MKNAQLEIVAAAKIVSAVLLVGIGAVGLYADFYPHSVRTRVGVALLALGLWLLVGAWTGRSIGARLRAFYLFSGAIGVSPSRVESGEDEKLAPNTGVRNA